MEQHMPVVAVVAVVQPQHSNHLVVQVEGEMDLPLMELRQHLQLEVPQPQEPLTQVEVVEEVLQVEHKVVKMVDRV
jgi:hypothetical protein